MSIHRTYAENMLPNQPIHRCDFRGDEKAFNVAMLESIFRSSDLSPPTVDFDLVLSDRFSIEEMASHPLSLRLLQFLIRISRAKRILEIGAFIGVSAMSMARALPPDGHIVSIEKFSEFADICRQNFRRNGLENRITLLEGDAMDLLPTLASSPPFDFVFLDGNKERYLEYFEQLDPLLSPQGLFVADNMFMSGDVFNDPPANEKARGVKMFLDGVSRHNNYFRMLLPIYDGVMIMQKTPK